MKKLVLILFILCLSFKLSLSQSGWVLQSPLPTDGSLSDLQFLDRNTGYICGGSGKLIKTTDSGNNWTVYNTSDPVSFSSMFFLNVNTGFLSGYYNGWRVYKTTNGGINWTYSSHRVARAIYFTDENTGYNADSVGLQKTTDGGLTWFLENIPSTVQIGAIRFINSSTGFAGGADRTGEALVFKTTDAGENWIETHLNKPYGIVAASFVDSLNGFLINYGDSYTSFLFKTTDAGNTWTPIQLPNYQYHARSISFINSNTGYMVAYQPSLGQASTIFKTTNSGLNWDPVFPCSGMDGISAIYSVDDNLVFAVGYVEIVKSTNQGTEWSYLGSFAPPSVKSVYFIDQMTGISVGEGISRTTNGGNNWTPVPTGGSDPLLPFANYSSVIFLNNLTGFAMGNQLSNGPNIIIKSTDCGLTWIRQNVPSGSEPSSMYFINQTTGFLLDPSGSSLLFRTTTQGNDWYRIQINNDSALINAIWFSDQNTGYIAGQYYGNYYEDSAEIYKTTNSGINWFRMNLNQGSITLSSISFPSEYTGYILGDDNKILKTTNAGINWSLNILNNINGITKIRFVNNQTGYGLGLFYNGVIKTKDGGNTWSHQDCGTGLSDLFFINDTTGWVCGGYYSEIYRTTNGGGPIGIKQISQIIPQEFNLYQNYPNPFNPTTKIKFAVPSAWTVPQTVRLTIYDILGRKVATLVNENLKPGQHETIWDASNFASGIYFYQLIAVNADKGQFTQTKKMVLIK